MKSMPMYSKALDANIRNGQILYRCRIFKNPNHAIPFECVMVATRVLYAYEKNGFFVIKIADSPTFSDGVLDRTIALSGWRTTKSRAIKALAEQLKERKEVLQDDIRRLDKSAAALEVLTSELRRKQSCTKDRTGKESQTSLS